jgi:glycosyltransferase 2 family protein
MNNDREKDLPHLDLEAGKATGVRSNVYQAILTIIKIAIGIALLVLSLQGIQFDHLIAGMRSANLTWLFLTLLLIVFGLGVKLWRWAILIRNYHVQVTPTRLFSAYFVGQATNIILPLRGGELVRLGYFADAKTLLPQAASTILLEKYLDLVSLTICGLLISWKISLDNILNLRGWLLPLTVVATLILFAAILFGPSLWVRIRERKLLPQSLAIWLDTWVQASQWLRSPIQVIPSVLLTTLIWGVMWMTNLFLFKSLGLPVDLTAGGLVLVLVYIGLFPALMPGNIGPFYFFARLALLPFDIIQDQAITFAVLLHAIVTLPPLLAGLIGLILRSRPPEST